MHWCNPCAWWFHIINHHSVLPQERNVHGITDRLAHSVHSTFSWLFLVKKITCVQKYIYFLSLACALMEKKIKIWCDHRRMVLLLCVVTESDTGKIIYLLYTCAWYICNISQQLPFCLFVFFAFFCVCVCLFMKMFFLLGGETLLGCSNMHM